MTKIRVVLICVLVLLVQTPQFAQDSSIPNANTDRARHAVAIGLLRTINTAEVTNKMRNGSYLTWQTLLSSQPKYFEQFLQRNGGGLQLKDAPEVLPGWNLRLNVHTDGQGYDVLLMDVTDQKCGYAALTDEGGVIRQSKAIDCKI